MSSSIQPNFRAEHNLLFQSLSHQDFAQAVVNFIDKTKTGNFKIISKPHSIVILSEEICIAIERMISQCQRTSWAEASVVLARYFVWEFEDCQLGT